MNAPSPPAVAAPPFPDRALRARCTRFLSGHGPASPRRWIERLAASPDLDLLIDEYGKGPAIERLEREVAALLGKEAGLFFHKGVTAQQAALLVHAGVTNRRVVALHPKSHLAFDETDALDRLAALVPMRIGADHRPILPADLASITEPLAALTVELPLRRAAFQAPSWDALATIARWARERAISFHLDGARIWEVQPWYGRPLAEIAGLADTVYVSFYKGLGGMGGCVLAGPRAFVDAARPWRNRYGGDLHTAFPFVLTALDGLRRHLPRMADYHRHAVAIAAAIDGIDGVSAFPAVPHGNALQVHFRCDGARLRTVATAIAEERGWWLLNRCYDGAGPHSACAEISVGEATLGWSADEVAAAIREVAARCAC